MCTFSILLSPKKDPLIGRNIASVDKPVPFLPPELLGQVFSYCLLDANGGMNAQPYYGALHTLAQVCRAWSAVIKETPSFWNLLQVAHTMNWKTVLKKSGATQALALRFDYCDSDESLRLESQNQELLRDAIKHVDRWRSLEFNPAHPGQIEVLQSHLPSIPSLENLKMHMTKKRYPPQGLFSIAAPNLQCLSLRAVSVHNWDGPMFHDRLRELHLFDLSPEHAPSVRQLINVLRSAPNLRELHVARAGISQGRSPEPPMTHNHLRNLRLRRSGSTAMLQLLVALRLPQCVDYSLSSGGTALRMDTSC